MHTWLFNIYMNGVAKGFNGKSMGKVRWRSVAPRSSMNQLRVRMSKEELEKLRGSIIPVVGEMELEGSHRLSEWENIMEGLGCP